MNAAIYARKSTSQDGMAEDAKSVERQKAGAKAFIVSKGWSLDPAHIYEDDGKSGALFATRRAFQRMLSDAKGGAFDALVIYDLDRFGRHAQKTMEALHLLADAGVTVYDYSTGQSVDIESFEGGTMTFLRASFAQQYREQIRKHTRAALRRKAEQGYVTGGKVFGYDNVRIGKGHVERRINEVEAAIVRDIYARAARGEGARTIAKALNAGGVPKPRAQQGRRDGWSSSTIRAVLERQLYRGEGVYGRTAKAYGRELKKVYHDTPREKGQVPRDEGTWTRFACPAIIDAELAASVDERRADRRGRYLASLKKPRSRMPEKAHGKYLLSGGMLVCPVCSGHFEVLKTPWKSDTDAVYVCSTRRRKPGVCPNTMAMPMAETDDIILSVIEGEVLDPNYVDALLAQIDHAPDEGARLRAEIGRLVALVAAGVASDTVSNEIRQREQQVRTLDARLRQPRPCAPDRAALRTMLLERADQWRTELRSEPRLARLLVRALMNPLTLHDDATRPDFIPRWQAETKPAGLCDGLYNWMASPTGTEASACRIDLDGFTELRVA